MHEYNHQSFSLSDIGDIISDLLNNRRDDLSSDQREALTRRQREVERLRQSGDPDRAEEEKKGLFDDLLRIAGPIIIGYAIRAMQDRMRDDREREQNADEGYRQPPQPAAPQYGTYREGDAVYRSTPGGQSVEEVD